ncbi:MAG: TylF/MycF/NovP-related O-methyltransferase [Novipirellula sp. JB048]
MTSTERVFALCEGVEYVIEHQIPGAIVECGVWKGGSMMAVAKTLVRLNHTRPLFLFDTFDGMTAPSDLDVDIHGESAAELLSKEDKETSCVWAYGELSEVQKNIAGTGYDQSNIVYVKGPVEETIPAQAPDQIALLRLDTDWYESTHHELQHLYPRLSIGGVLIIDDYGHWGGARKAVDQYIADNRLKLLLNRIDYTGRIAVKLE